MIKDKENFLVQYLKTKDQIVGCIIYSTRQNESPGTICDETAHLKLAVTIWNGIDQLSKKEDIRAMTIDRYINNPFESDHKQIAIQDIAQQYKIPSHSLLYTVFPRKLGKFSFYDNEEYEKIHKMIQSLSINRWHTSPRISPETVGLHVSRMLMVYMAVVKEPKIETIKAILTHDVAEIYTGDVPSGTKTKEFKAYEDKFNKYFGNLFIKHDMKIVNFLDQFDAYYSTFLEVKMGNKLALAKHKLIQEKLEVMLEDMDYCWNEFFRNITNLRGLR